MAVKMSAGLRRKVEALPRRPGVYMFKDARREVIYVGKAKDLRARVRSYFQEGGDEWRLICKRIEQVADVACVVTRSEKEALLLESNFVKQFRPKYNVCFRDDKSFVSIKINLAEPWPRPAVTRRLGDRDALYFGPYASAKAARRTVRVLQDVFPLRKCSIRQCRARARPCLYGEMGKCAAPCCSDVTEQDYRRLIDQVVMFLKGRGDELLAQLRGEMQGAAAGLGFEKAARLRDRIRAVETTLETQHVSSSQDDVDRDIFGVCTLGERVAVSVLLVRDGNVRDVASYRFPADLDSEEAIFGSFLVQFYSHNRFIPREVLVPVPVAEAGLLAEWLSEKKGRKVRVIRPQRGAKRRLVELANRNARQTEEAATSGEEKRRLEMESLQAIAGLANRPRVIECFDISTLHGREAVGSMVVFRDGDPDKGSYRHYRIRQAEGQDDVAMMREVLTRRYSRAEEPPELVLVDGGKGQLGAALDVLDELGVESCDVAALAKARSAGGRQLRAERLFLPGRGDPVEVDPVEVPERTHGFRLITRVRDEAHRFAVSYHRKLRRKAAVASPLEEIRGVGRETARRLLEAFGGLNKVKEASVEELKAAPRVSDALARAIYAYYHERASGGVEQA